MHYVDPVSLYIVTKPNDKARLKPLVRIVVNMIVRLLADKLDFENGRPKPSYKHRLLAMIDEFPALGKLEILQESLAFVAGYGYQMLLDQPGHRPAQKPRDRLRTRRNHYLQLSYPDSLPSKSSGYRRASLKAHRSNHHH